MSRTISMVVLAIVAAASLAGANPPTPTAEKLFCEITDIRSNGTVIVKYLGTDENVPLEIIEETRFLAQSPEMFGGRKKIARVDLRIGQQLKVVIRSDFDGIFRIVVLDPARAIHLRQ